MTVLLVPSAVGRSHLTRLLLVALALRERDIRATFAYGGVHTELLAGFEHRPVADADVRDFSANVWAAYTPEVVERAIVDLRATAAATQARTIVFDLHPAAPIAAHLAGLPCTSVTNADLTAGFDLAGAFGRRRARVAAAIRAVQARAAAGGLRRVARAHGLRDRRSVFDFARGDTTLLADLPEWTPSRRLAAATRYAGPLIWEEPGDPPAAPRRGARRIYVTIGNTGGPSLLDVAMAAFADDPAVELVISSGAYVDPPRRPGVLAERFLPGGAVARSSELVVHSGGNGTMYQVLAAGRPSVVVPFSAGQRVNAQLTVHHRVGVAFEPRRLTPERLRAGVLHVTSTPGFTVAATGFARRIGESDGARTAAAAIADTL